jgi:hypothetical protein
MSAPKLMPALLGGLFIGVLSSLPIIDKGNLCCCLWVVTGGVLAAWLMQQNTPRPVTLGEGAIVGLLAGLVGVATTLVLRAGGAMLFGTPNVVDEIKRGMEAGARDPEARAVVEGMGPLVLLGIFGLIFAVASTVMATIGGLLGALIFRRKGDGTMPPPSGPPAPMAPMPPAPPPASVPPPSFTPPAPPPPPAPPQASAAPPPMPLAAPAPPPSPTPVEPEADEPYAGDAPTILIPMRGPTLGPPPAPPARPVPPADDGDPESH